jgi:N-acetylneuraminate synthase
MKNKTFNIERKSIGLDSPTYFIADIAANHDGSLEKAKELIYLSAEAGADAAKFQHFAAETIVSDFGFKSLGNQQSHQASWEKSVFEVYNEASLPKEWTEELRDTCIDAGITFFTSPYSIELIDYVDPYVPAYKIGSGDLTSHTLVNHMLTKDKPLILATGASDMEEIKIIVNKILKINDNFVLMQCNTNYTASLENFKYINLNVLTSFASTFPGVILGLSDHTPGHSTVLGAVALGARVIEKHFTDECGREGPDHKFSMDPVTWKEMVDRTRELESSLGDGVKKIEANEKETVILQRRSIRLKNDMSANGELKPEDLEILRPCPLDSIPPSEISAIIGRTLKHDLKKGEYLRWTDLK